jgi:hypothetical protein
MLVKTFFDSAEFRNQPAKVKDYVRGALGSGGAAYYKIPVPVSCKLRKDDPNYLVSFFYHCRFMLTFYFRNQMAFYAPSLSSQLPRHTLALQQSQSSVHLWDRSTHQQAFMRSF